VKDVKENSFNKALRLVMAEFCISNTDLAKYSGLSENSISNARKDKGKIYSTNIIKISNALAQINSEAHLKFWQLASGFNDLGNVNIELKTQV
jgi:predicted transcriptional regulator